MGRAVALRVWAQVIPQDQDKFDNILLFDRITALGQTVHETLEEEAHDRRVRATGYGGDTRP